MVRVYGCTKSGLLTLEQYWKNQEKRTGKRFWNKRINKNTEAIIAAQEDRWKRRENVIRKGNIKLQKILKNKQKKNG